MWLSLVVIAVTTIIIIKLKQYRSIYSYWRNLGVDTPRYYYYVGNILQQFIYRKTIGMIVTEAYNEFKTYNYFGFYNSTTPVLVVRNPDIIKDILIKDFSSFHDNTFEVDSDDPIMGKSPFVLNGDQWKTVRTQIAPCFTTNKTKLMIPLLHETSKKLQRYLESTSTIAIDAKLLAMRITTENIASCAFGIDGGSLPEQKELSSSYTNNAHKQDFFQITQRLLTRTFWQGILSFVLYIFPFLQPIFKISESKNEDSVEFLQEIIKDSLEHRRRTNTRRDDFLQLLKERMDTIQDENLFNMSDVFGHAAGFLVDGIDTSSIVLSHALYELGRCSDVQDRLRNEINEMYQHIGIDDNLSYEQIHGMKYLSAVFNEVLRLHPPFFMMLKRVTQPYTLGPMCDTNLDYELKLDVDTCVIIPLYGLHLDENYHENADQFKPERFLDGKDGRIAKFTYLPFGEGPRMCLGMKFGMLQIKLALIAIVRNYGIGINDRTAEPVECDPSSFINSPKGGYWIDLVKL